MIGLRKLCPGYRNQPYVLAVVCPVCDAHKGKICRNGVNKIPAHDKRWSLAYKEAMKKFNAA